MNQEFLSERHNRLCEAVGCNEKAATIIQVKVDKHNSIPLFVCERCVNKFSQEGTNPAKNKWQPTPVLNGTNSYTEGKADT